MRASFILIGLVLGGLTTEASWAIEGTDAKIHQDIHQLKKDYQKKVNKELKGIGVKIQRLEHQGTKAEDRVKGDIDKEVNKLKLKKADVDRKFKELGHSTGNAWKDLRQGVDDAVNDLKKAVDDATERFKEKK